MVADHMSRNPLAKECSEVEERVMTTNLDSLDLEMDGRQAQHSIAAQLYMFGGCIPSEQYDVLKC